MRTGTAPNSAIRSASSEATFFSISPARSPLRMAMLLKGAPCKDESKPEIAKRQRGNLSLRGVDMTRGKADDFQAHLSRIHAVENHEWTRINTNRVVPGAVLRTDRRVTIQ